MNRRIGRLKIPDMAGSASGAQAYILPDRFSLMTTLAVNGGMRPHQRESVLVSLNGLQRGTPAAHRVASVAFSTELTAMNIRMAIGAFGSHFREDKVLMALAAVNALMHAPYRESSLAVIKIRVGPNMIPADFGVAAPTGHGQISVRISRPALDDLSVREIRYQQKEKKNEIEIPIQNRTDKRAPAFQG